MDDVTVKLLIIEVDNEAVLKYPIPIFKNGEGMERLEAILASNPIIRIVDSAEIGDVWDGQKYSSPTE